MKRPRASAATRRTVKVDYDGHAIAVDTGFIVFNRPNYPNLSGLFAHLNVPTHASDMTFAASIRDGWLEWGAKDLDAVLGQRRNLLRPRFGLSGARRDDVQHPGAGGGGAPSRSQPGRTDPEARIGRMVSPVLSSAHVGRDLELPALRDDELPGPHPGPVLRQSSSVVLYRPAALADCHRRRPANMSAALPLSFARRIRTDCGAVAVTRPTTARMPARSRSGTARADLRSMTRWCWRPMATRPWRCSRTPTGKKKPPCPVSAIRRTGPSSTAT